MNFLDFRVPANGFDRPVSMWLACHERLESVCRVLQRLVQHVVDFGIDDAAMVSAEGVRKYFNSAIARHHDDEDLDLFPCLLERLRGRRRTVAHAMLDRLREEHVHAETLWQPVDSQLASVQRGEKVPPKTASISALIDRHLSHRLAEESALLELLQATLLPIDLTHIGQSMAARRGLAWARLNQGLL